MRDLKSQFIDWVGRQDPEARFDPWDNLGCAGYQFLRAAGFPVGMCGVWYWYEPDGRQHALPDAMAAAISWAADHHGAVSFGALATRLSTLSVGGGR